VNILEKPEGTMANTQNAADGASRVELLRTEIPETDDRELVMSLLALAPGGTAPIHKHPGIGIGYVLEGVYESQYEGEPLKRFAAGEAIYDLQDKPQPDRTEWQQHRAAAVNHDVRRATRPADNTAAIRDDKWSLPPEVIRG
jgi:Cupin domain